MIARLLLGAMEANPNLARRVVETSPPSVVATIRVFRESMGLSREHAASLVLTGVLTLLACALTVVPLYWLARSTLTAPAAWVSASFWPLVPSALLFQPTADTAFPLLSTSAMALALACRSGSARGWLLGAASGLVMAAGMAFTLAFLPVGLVVAILLLTHRDLTWRRRASLILATGGRLSGGDAGVVGGDLCESVRDLVGQPEEPRAVLRRVPPELSRLAAREPDRTGRWIGLAGNDLGGHRARLAS